MSEIFIDRNALQVIKCKHVKRHFPYWQFARDSDDSAYFEGWVTPEDSNTAYLLRLCINPECPEVCPELYVWEPIALPRVPSGTINEVTGHETHTRGNGPDGRVQICWIDPADWDATISFVRPILTGHLWLEAYAAHMKTGKPIVDYFPQ